MRSLLVCTAVLLAAVAVPIEEPSARAENWQPLGEGLCMDQDSVQAEGGLGDEHEFATWSVDFCPPDPRHGQDPAVARVDCLQPDAESKGYYTIDLRFRTGETEQFQFPEKGKLVNDICVEINQF
jgi:hypothetical protein